MMRIAKIIIWVSALFAGLAYCYAAYASQGYRLCLGREPRASGAAVALGPAIFSTSAFPPDTGGTLFWFRDAAVWEAFRAKNIGKPVPGINFGRQTVMAVFVSGRGSFEEIGAAAEGPKLSVAFREVVSLPSLMNMITHCAYTGSVRVYVLNRGPERIMVHINRWEFGGFAWRLSVTKTDPLPKPGGKPVSRRREM